jgi:glycogen debranching enzyme
LADAQTDAAVARFEIPTSSLQLSGDVRSGAYLGVMGRRSAWLGSEMGRAELWVHPLKLAGRFELAFRIPDYVDPIRGRDVARRVEIRPELTTIVYSHATFTVRQHILAPLDAPGLLVLLDVQTFRPLEIDVSFRSLLEYAWPGSLGGQYIFWNQDERAFVLSESLRRHSAFIGSPWATSASAHPAHALPDAPSKFTIAVDIDRARREFIPIAIAAGLEPRDSVQARYRRLIANARDLYEEKRRHVTRLREETVSLDSPDDMLDLALEWAKINLDEQVVCNPDLGCGLVAGWGPSGDGARPGFGWFFGGDAAINSFAMSLAGQWTDAAAGLRFLARYQREDGKMPHEISQSAAHIPWFTDFPYPYYHADTTPYWLVALHRYWRASGDEGLLAELWPAARKAFDWCLSVETDGDGIVENTTGGLGAIELGALGEAIHQDIYLAAVWIAALEGMQEMAAARGENDLAAQAAGLRATAAQTLESRYWLDDAGHYAFGILRSGKTNDVLTVWPATAAAFGLFQPDRADRALASLASDRISADWGARMVSTASELYDPMHYNNGAVWPFVTGFVSLGQYAYRRPWSGFPLVDAVKQLTFDWARGRHPELLSGTYYRPLDTAVPQQFFATSMLASPLLAGIIGWEPDAPNGRARLEPQLPPHWDRTRVRNLPVGDTRLDVEMLQAPGGIDVIVKRTGPPIELDFALSLPAGARDVEAAAAPVEGGGAAGRATGNPEIRSTPRETLVRWSVPLTETTTRFLAGWSGGLAVEPPVQALEPGQTSHGLRILDFRFEDEGWLLTVEGSVGHSYEVRLHGQPVRPSGTTPGVVVGQSGESWTQLHVKFEEPGDRAPGAEPAAALPISRAVLTIRLDPVSDP